MEETSISDILSKILKALKIMKKLDSYTVSLNKNSYGIYIGRNLLKSLDDFIPKETKYSKIIVVTDKIIQKNGVS